MSKFNLDEFCNHLNFKLAPLFDENSCSVNELFNRLISIFVEVVDQFAPKRKASRKEKLRLKPWITNGLLKSIRNKNKMFKRLQNHHNNLALNEVYKTYRNTLNRSLRLAEQNHYHNIHNEHKGNSKKA